MSAQKHASTIASRTTIPSLEKVEGRSAVESSKSSFKGMTYEL